MNLCSYKKYFSSITIVFFLLVFSSASAFAAESNKADNAPMTTKKNMDATKELTKEEQKKAKVQKGLEQFVSNQLDSFNRTTLHSEKRKLITKNNDGTFTASYTHFNKESITCYFTETENTSSGVAYIGHFSYIQEEFQCTAETAKLALQGPFVKTMQTPISELAKYKKEKWSY